MKKRILSLILVLLLVVSLAGCQNSADTQAETQSANTAPVSESPAQTPESAPPQDSAPPQASPEQPEPAQSEPEPEPEPISEPIVYEMPLTDTMVDFSFWIEGAPPFVTPTLGADQSYNTSEASLYLKNLSNVNIEFIEVDMFSRSEKFNLMVVSGNYPDLTSGFKGLYSGGPDQALEDEVIIDVTDMINNDMPAYKKILEENPVYEKELLNDNSQMLFISGFNDEVYAANGAAIRKDWLDAVGMGVPTTYDELYEVSKAFLVEFNPQMSLFLTKAINPGTSFSGGFGLPGFDINSTGSHFYQIGGEVKSAYVEDDLKDMLLLMRQWYADGIIDQDFYTAESGQYAESTIFSDNCGVFWGPANFITQYNETTDLKEKGFYSVAMPIMRKQAGEVIHFTTAASNSYGINDLCISSTCDNLDILAKWLDFHFTEAGQLLDNYGMEGKTYEFDADGNPQYYPELYSTPGTNFMQNASNYIYNSAPSLYVAKRVDRVSFDDVASEAVELYNEGIDSAWDLPTNLYMTQEENEVYYARIGDIETYVATEMIKFITGETDIESEWDAYTGQIMKLGMQQCIDMKQAAYDRYLER